MVRSVGFGGSVWVMGKWSVGQWIVGVMRFHKIIGLYIYVHIYSVELHKIEKWSGEVWVLGGFGGSGGLVGLCEWSVGQWVSR